MQYSGFDFNINHKHAEQSRLDSTGLVSVFDCSCILHTDFDYTPTHYEQSKPHGTGLVSIFDCSCILHTGFNYKKMTEGFC
jgi:hypothetical protein